MGRFYKINTQGKHWLQRTDVPVWTPNDEGRILYDSTSQQVVYGNASEWKSTGGEAYNDVPLNTILLVDSDVQLAGYQLQTDVDDRVIYVSKGAGGANGVGADNFGTWTQPVHTHTQPTHTHTLGSHTHTLGSHTHAAGSHIHAAGSHIHTAGSHTHTAGSHTHTIISRGDQASTRVDFGSGYFLNTGAVGYAQTNTGLQTVTNIQWGTSTLALGTLSSITDSGSGDTGAGAGNTGAGSGNTGAGSGNTDGPSAASDGPTGGSDPSGADVTGTPSVTQENSFKGTWRPNGRNFTRQKRI